MKNPSTSFKAFFRFPVDDFNALSITSNSSFLFIILFSCPASIVSPTKIKFEKLKMKMKNET